MVNWAPVLTLWAARGKFLEGQRTAPEDAQEGTGDH